MMKFKHISLICALAVILAGSFLLPAFGMEVNESFAYDSYANGSLKLSMDVSCGYQNNAKVGRYIPVKYSIKSQSDVPFTGTLRVEAMESDYDIYQYDYKVSVDAMGDLEKSLDIPVGRAEILYVKLLDDHGTELIKKRIKLNVSDDIARLFVGVLTDHPDKLFYLNGVGVNYSSVEIKTFDMSAEELTDHVIGLSLLDVIVISDYDTRKLSKDQINAIWEWIKEGGTLLIGTGARADDTLFAFRKELLSKEYDTPKERAVDMGVEYATNGPGDSFLDLVCADVSIKGGTEVLSNDQFSVLTSVTKGKGSIGVAAYDFVDIASFCKDQRSYVDKLFTALLGEGKLSNLSSYLYSGNNGQYWSVQNMLNTGDVDKLPDILFYSVVIFAYILIVGPGLYLILRRKEQRQYYRTGVVAVSLVFTAVVYLMGVGTRFKDTFFTYATILDSNDNYVDEYTYLNMRTPYNKSYHISLDPSYNLLPITRSNLYGQTVVPRFTGTEDAKVKIGFEKERTNVSVQNTAAFTPLYYSLRRRISNPDHKGLLGNITLFEGNIYGTITNQYPFPVEKLGILMYGKMVVIDELRPGEVKSLDGLTVINYPVNSSLQVAARVTGGYLYPQADIEDPAYMLALSRTNILSFYLDKYSSFYNQEARIVAFSKEQNEKQFLENGNYDTYGMSMFTSTVDIKMKKKGLTSRSALMKAPNVISGQFYSETNSIYGVDPVALEYYLGNDLSVEKLTFENPSADFLKNDTNYYTNIFKGKIYFYNHNTGNYDDMEDDKTIFYKGELAPYLSPGNTLTVKYVCEDTSENDWYVTLPMLTVVGRDK